MPQVFNKTEVYQRMTGGTAVIWSIHPLFRLVAPYTFSVYVSADGGAAEDFELVGTTSTNNFVIDQTQRNYGLISRAVYKIVLVDGNNQEYSSPNVLSTGNFSDHDYLIAQEMIRKEGLRNMKFVAHCGYLWKRRQWGTPCTACADWGTNEPTKSICNVCYGTGKVGGYFEPLLVYMADSSKGPPYRVTSNENKATEASKIIYGRTIACPWLDTNDIWGDADTDHRYVVQSVDAIELHHVPIILDPVELRLAPATDVIYTLPRPEDLVSSS
jgi:hypothetical protein